MPKARKLIIILSTMAVFSLYPTKGYSFAAVVSDPTNLVQNTVTAATSLKQWWTALWQQYYQYQQLQAQLESLKKLDPSSLTQLRSSFTVLEGVKHQIDWTASEYRRANMEFDQRYKSFVPPKKLEKQEKDIRDATDASIEEALASHVSANELGERVEMADRLAQMSAGSTGNAMQSIQVSNEILSALLKQIIEVAHLISVDSKARMTHIKQTKARHESDKRIATARIKGGWEVKPDWDVMQSYPSFENPRAHKHQPKVKTDYRSIKQRQANAEFD